MADWALASCEQQEFSTAVASRSTANTKGAYAQLRAATSFAYSALTIQLAGTGGGGQCYLVDIAIGAAGSEQVIVPNVFFDTFRGVGMNSLSFTLPLSLPSGVRISARCQEMGGAGTRDVDVSLIGRAGGSNYPAAVSGEVKNYGANPATGNGLLLDPGAVANTYGAWVEMTASTTRSHSMLLPIIGTNLTTSGLGQLYDFQVSIGASGSEVVIGQWRSNSNANASRMSINTFDIYASVPEGARLAMRSRCSGALATDRNVTAVLMGC